MRKKIILACSECHNRNYTTYKNSKSDSDRLVIKKYCRQCGKQTLHSETK
ncbi:50S ribosomal protein L33 [Virgibacillus sp. MSP4-1]|nr:50S ribosomal protein L33 [Virgibacillus sp. MSP4-1]QHS23926.1 50S ribosomal protein L33 [Virgibacillus sp. MSP4-1]